MTWIDLPLAAWPTALADSRRRLVIEPRWHGRQVRRDAWRARGASWDWEVLYLVESGTCSARCDGVDIALEPGSLFWWPAGRPLHITWPQRFVFCELWFRLEGLRLAGPPQVVADAWDAVPWLQAASDCVAQGWQEQQERLRHLIALVLLEFIRPRRVGRLTATERRVIDDLLVSHIERGLTPAALASALGRSPTACARAVRATYGCPPRTWILQERMRHAARLLRESELTVAEVAERLGYGEAAPFSRAFRRVLGLSPDRWRRR